MKRPDLLRVIEQAAEDVKARDIVVIDLEGKTSIADYFVVCEGDTSSIRTLKGILGDI